MPPRPFPQNLSIGTDICHYTRFSKYFPTHQNLENTTTKISSQTLLFKLFDRAFLPSEQRDFWRRFHAPSATSRQGVSGSGSGAFSSKIPRWDRQRAEEAARYIGGRWAAKEAVIKAFASERRLMLRDVEIRKDVKTKQPLAVVFDETSNTKHQSAKEVYASLVKRWQLREELSKQQKEGAADGTPTEGLSIIKQPLSKRHTARRLEYKNDLHQQGSNSEAKSTPASVPTPSILSEKGILDFNAVTQILSQDQDFSSSPSTNPAQERQQEKQQQKQDTDVQGNLEELQSERSRIHEEMMRLRKEEQAEDAWNNLQGQVVKVSISHDGEYCVATALAAV